MRISSIGLKETKNIILDILQHGSLLSTAEIIDLAIKKSNNCRDKIPQALVLLQNDGLIEKRLSKEKKGFIWKLTSFNS